MAPGTHIGAAHPVSGTGEKMSETVEKKAAPDTAAYARSLAQARHRNVALAEEAVTAEPRVHRQRGARGGAAADRPRRRRAWMTSDRKLDGRTVIAVRRAQRSRSTRAARASSAWR